MPLDPEASANLGQIAFSLRDRSPHPYARHGAPNPESSSESYRSNGDVCDNTYALGHDNGSEDGGEQNRHKNKRVGASSNGSSSTASESGTEADDERPRLLKALPPATFRPRKGLKRIDGGASPLLTPSQLDVQGRQLSQGYFDPSKLGKRSQSPDGKELEIERQKFEVRRRAERIRRLSEGLLVAFIGLIVACGPLVWLTTWRSHLGE